MAASPPTTSPVSDRRNAPGPRGLPLLGIMPEIRRDVLGYLERLVREYGDVVRYRLGPMTSHLVVHPEGVRRVLQENVKNYTKDHFSYTMVRWVTGDGLLTSQGDFWLRQRRLAQPAFHRKRIAALGAVMSAAAEDMLARWEEPAARDEPLDIAAEMTRTTLRIVGDSLFGADVTGAAGTVSESFTTLSDQLVRRFRGLNVLPPVLPTAADRAWRGAARSLDAVVYRIIGERRRDESDHGDLLSMLMLARDEETGERMNDRQLRDEVLTMLVAGHETTAVTLTWAWLLLARHPEAETRLHAELDSALGGRAPTIDDLPNLPYARMVIDETLRLYPPVYVLSRKVKEDDEIGGFRIPRGTSVDLSPYVTHRHPALWERPEAFEPERFAPEQAAERPRFAYFPFSGGPRQCIGNSFALVEAQLVLATVAQRYRLRPVSDAPLEMEPLVTLRPKGAPRLLPVAR